MLPIARLPARPFNINKNFLSLVKNQSETLTNLKGALQPGQLLIDATVPLAAAVSGRATRMLGVWQGSAAQQAQRWLPKECGSSPRCTRSAPRR